MEQRLIIVFVVLRIVYVATVVFHGLPLLAMLARGEKDHVVAIMQMVKRVTTFRPDAAQVSLPFEDCAERKRKGRRRLRGEVFN